MRRTRTIDGRIARFPRCVVVARSRGLLEVTHDMLRRHLSWSRSGDMFIKVNLAINTADLEERASWNGADGTTLGARPQGDDAVWNQVEHVPES